MAVCVGYSNPCSCCRLQCLLPYRCRQHYMILLIDDGEKVVICPRSVYVSRPGYTLLSVGEKTDVSSEFLIQFFVHLSKVHI